jgi:dTDP-glucose pyrophosphorylase
MVALARHASLSNNRNRAVRTQLRRNFYIGEGKLTYEILDGWSTDAGTFESLLRANTLVAETGANKLPKAIPPLVSAPTVEKPPAAEALRSRPEAAS